VTIDDWHWFDLPEMQARIAEAEADLREGRVTDSTAEKYLRRLRHLIRPSRRATRYIAKGGVRK
jgi:hypothetical protein